MKKNYVYKCINCKKEFNEKLLYLCPECEKKNIKNTPMKGTLKVIYDYNSKKEFNSFGDIKNIWPIESINELSFLKVGNTPLYEKKYNNENLYFKFDSLNPSYSFKDRASDLVCYIAKSNNIDTVITASTGNAASSLAGISASYGIKSVLFVPKSAPKAKLLQSALYGGNIIPIDGTYDDAFDLSIEASEKFDWYNRNTGYNPFTIEGKKSVSIELYLQFKEKNQKIPEVIFVPVGDGVIISGVYKGFEDLLKLKKIDKMPTIVAVQSSKSRNLINNLENDDFKCENATTLADSISVNIPRNFYMAKDFIKKYSGIGLEVDDEEIINASFILGKTFGLFAEPAAAAAYAGYLKYKKENNFKSSLILLTGSGLKDINAIEKRITLPKAISNLKNFNMEKK